jgi:hypothetical protein
MYIFRVCIQISKSATNECVFIFKNMVENEDKNRELGKWVFFLCNSNHKVCQSEAKTKVANSSNR